MNGNTFRSATCRGMFQCPVGLQRGELVRYPTGTGIRRRPVWPLIISRRKQSVSVWSNKSCAEQRPLSLLSVQCSLALGLATYINRPTDDWLASSWSSWSQSVRSVVSAACAGASMIYRPPVARRAVVLIRSQILHIFIVSARWTAPGEHGGLGDHTHTHSTADHRCLLLDASTSKLIGHCWRALSTPLTSTGRPSAAGHWLVTS